MTQVTYAGFWIRTGAAIIDSILLLLVILPAVAAIYDISIVSALFVSGGLSGALLNYLFPAVAIMLFWIYKSATPGKLLTHTTIVDANTGEKPTPKQFLIRYVGYYLAMLPLFLGIIWVGVDKRKQGWHDKLAQTVVIKSPASK
ncbi:RDD family protein [Alteromonas lipolytica]|nr:RDD family protein [Alteromonas lipolytica]GGF74172.1 RDD family protein [Alteromonas lipolytica]